MLGSTRDFTRRLLAWYDRARRDLPWRVAPGSARDARPDPYHVLVSEAMLQQTQVATVIPYFARFIGEFPDVRTLASADEQAVLRAWQGLGYYSRARNLQRAARQIVDTHCGQVPRDVVMLLTLPGVGRYTAGAIASLAFGVRAPILDGNVARVLCRLDLIESDPRQKDVQARLWKRAEELVPQRRPGDFNSATMELGATVCTPRSPQCLICPVRAHCQAFDAGAHERIPVPRQAKPRPLLRRHVFCIRRPSDDRYLIHQRPPRGRWAGMWQFITVEVDGTYPIETTRRRKLGTVRHALTHRRYEFQAFSCEVRGVTRLPTNGSTYKWVRLDELDRYPLSKPQLAVVQLLRQELRDTV